MHIPKKLLKFFLAVVIVLCIFGYVMSGKYVVPVMMYHKVEGNTKPAGDVVSPEMFQYQMNYLQERGYNVLTLDELITGISQGKSFPKNSVVITFDDGYENNFTEAFPVLREHEFPATIFVAPDFIAKKLYMDLTQMLAMQRQGISFGSHGVTQAYLPDISDQDQSFEIAESKKILEEKFGVPIDYFAYPIGGFSDSIKQKIQQAGYKGAMATNRGYDRYNKDVYEINRIKFSDKDKSDMILWFKLSGYYNLFRKMKNPY